MSRGTIGIDGSYLHDGNSWWFVFKNATFCELSKGRYIVIHVENLYVNNSFGGQVVIVPRSYYQRVYLVTFII